MAARICDQVALVVGKPVDGGQDGGASDGKAGGECVDEVEVGAGDGRRSGDACGPPGGWVDQLAGRS